MLQRVMTIRFLALVVTSFLFFYGAKGRLTWKYEHDSSYNEIFLPSLRNLMFDGVRWVWKVFARDLFFFFNEEPTVWCAGFS